MARYKCHLCHKVVERADRNSETIISYCEKDQMMATMRKVREKPHKGAKKGTAG